MERKLALDAGSSSVLSMLWLIILSTINGDGSNYNNEIHIKVFDLNTMLFPQYVFDV